MSLPTYVWFYNAHGQEIGREFINIGWFFNPEALISTINRMKGEGCDLFDKCNYFIAYNLKIKRRYIDFPETWEKYETPRENT